MALHVPRFLPIVALLALVFSLIPGPQDRAFAAVTLGVPTSDVVVSTEWTDICTGSCTVTGFADDDRIRVVVTSGGEGPLAGKVRLKSGFDSATLQPVVGYNGNDLALIDDDSGHSEIAFTGTQSAVVAALQFLQYKAAGSGGNETISLSTTLAEVEGRTIHYNPDNGHYYEAVVAEGSKKNYLNAKSAAASATYNGLTGYLGTILTEEENNFIKDKVKDGNLWIGGEFDPASEDSFLDPVPRTTSYPSNTAGVWRWTTGPESGTEFWSGTRFGTAFGTAYSNWARTGDTQSQPDGSADCLVTNYLTDGAWDDQSCTATNPYLIEYGGQGEQIAKEGVATFTVSPTYTITYDANGATEGTVPDQTSGAGELTIAGNTGSLSKAGADFGGWATSRDGSGTQLNAGDNFTPTADTMLYAQFPESVDVPSSVDGFTTGFVDIGSAEGVAEIQARGFTGDVRVVISTNDSDGELRIPASVATNLTRVEGYDNSSVITASGSRIGFEGSQDDANAALAALEYESSGSAAKTDTITVEVSLAGVPELVIADGGQDYYHYYEFVGELDAGDGQMTWDEAKTDSAIARTLRGQTVTGWMATVESEKENAWITKYLNSDAWLGATDSAVEGDWRWVTSGDSVSGDLFWRGTSSGSVQGGLYANWASIEPNNSGNEDCAQFYARNTKAVNISVDGQPALTTSAYWNDLPCSGRDLEGYIWEYRSATSLSSTVTETFTVSVTPPDAPTRPSGLSAVGGYKSMALSWSAPSSPGSFPVTDYVVEYTEDPTGSWSVFADGVSTNTSATVTGLTPGTNYYFRVTARSLIDGNPSEATAATAVPTVAPLNVTGVAGNGQVVVSWDPPSVGTVTGYEVSQNPGELVCSTTTETTCTFTGLTNGQSYSFTVEATMADSDTFEASVTATPTAPAARTNRNNSTPESPAVIPPPRTTPNGTTPPRLPLPPASSNQNGVLDRPVDTPNQAANGSAQPRALIGGVPAPLETTREGNDQVRVNTGTVNLGLALRNGGTVSENEQTRQPELQVGPGVSTGMSGGGLLAGSTVQVWLPGPRPIELSRAVVGPDGAFTTEVSFSNTPGEEPLPIGRRVIQVTGVDQNGSPTVVEIPINVAQGPPTPEQNREAGLLPALSPGQSLATSGGMPTPVAIIPFIDQRSVSIDGGDWTLNVQASDDSGQLEDSNGAPLLRLTQSGQGSITGDGFLPETVASVWFFSEPTLLGTVSVDANGAFDIDFLVDEQFINPGEHTLQIQGVGTDGFIKAANLGVVVEAPVEATTSESASTLLWWMIAALMALLVVVFLVVALRNRRTA